MYAVIETGGKQYRVAPGETLEVERLAVAPGEQLQLGRVLMVADGDNVQVGTPTVAGASVVGTVLGEAKGKKIIVFRYKSKVRYRRKTGHRQALTRLRITDIVLPGAGRAAAPARRRGARAPDETSPPADEITES